MVCTPLLHRPPQLSHNLGLRAGAPPIPAPLTRRLPLLLLPPLVVCWAPIYSRLRPHLILLCIWSVTATLVCAVLWPPGAHRWTA